MVLFLVHHPTGSLERGKALPKQKAKIDGKLIVTTKKKKKRERVLSLTFLLHSPSPLQTPEQLCPPQESGLHPRSTCGVWRFDTLRYQGSSYKVPAGPATPQREVCAGTAERR